MIRIVGEDDKYFKQASCGNCAAKIEYTNSELRQVNGKDYSGGSDGREFIICPRCNHEVVLRSW